MLTENDRREIQLRELGGPDATERWEAAWKALQAYAAASGCPAGSNVYDWFTSRSNAFTRAIQEEMTASFDRVFKSPIRVGAEQP